jgi:hypothetical protein
MQRPSLLSSPLAALRKKKARTAIAESVIGVRVNPTMFVRIQHVEY